MSVQPSFKAAINILAELASDRHPAYVRVDAAGKLANFLNPANPHYGDILYELNGDAPGALLTLAAQVPTPPAENPLAGYGVKNDEEDDESEGSDQDDEPL